MRALLLVCLTAVPAAADPQLSPVTSRNYSIDLYDGIVIGNSATIAVGGAAVANAIGSSGTLINVSAPAVRQTTDTDDWSWDYHLDYLNSGLSADYANSGLPSTGGTSNGLSAITLGASVRWHDWAAAITAWAAQVQIGTMTELQAGTQRTKFALAHWEPHIDVAFGVAAQIAQFDLLPNNCSTADCKLFEVSGNGFEAGAQWIPRQQNFRIGVDVQTPITGGNVVADSCAGMETNCDGYMLPESVVSAWRVAGGAAYRWSETRWNQLVGGYFRDETSVTVTGDVVVTGPSPNAYGLDAFAQHELERSGSQPSVSLRGGVEYECLPGRLRLRGGSYWEPGRFDGVPGRLHGTAGLELRVFQFHLWGLRRGRITLTGDVAAQYKNGGISVGFWH